MEMHSELLMYIKAFRRKRMLFILPAVATMVVCALVTFMIPSVYRSTGVILIETADVPEDLVSSTISGLVEERVQGLSQIVLNRSQLLEIINRFDLYPEDAATSSTTELIENMRGDINVDMIQTEVHDTETARSGTATYAFSVSYEHTNPEKALLVANNLVSLYMQTNIESREQKTRSTYEYLESRIIDVEAQMADLQEQISVFKSENKYTLPELMPSTHDQLDRTEGRINYVEDRVTAKRERIRYWTSKEASTPKYIIVRTTGGERLITPEEQLDRMRRDYVAMLATRSKDHPDAQNLKKEIDALEQQVRRRQDIKAYQDQLESLENELAKAQEKYTSQHPDVQRLTAQVAKAQNDLRTLEERYSILAPRQEKEINPQWVHANTELQSTKMELVPLLEDLAKLEARHAELQRRIDENPQVELEYNALLHQLSSLQAEHEDLLSRTLAAKEAKGLEESGLGEQFTLIDPPVREEEPAKPNRPLLLALGLVLSLSVGTATGVLAEFMDRSVHNAEELAGLTGLPVLTVIPYIETDSERATWIRRRQIKIALIVGGAVLAVALFHVLIYPLDLLFFKVQGAVQRLF